MVKYILILEYLRKNEYNREKSLAREEKMALIKCPKCGKEISDKAKKCVGCGWKVDLDILNTKQNEIVSRNTSSETEMSHIEDERNKMLKDAELEIEKVKENARQKVKSINESAKAMVTQKQEELELAYRKKEIELAQQKESLEKSQKELEQAKKDQTLESQRVITAEKKNLSNAHILIFMIATILIMLCFMFIVWKKLDNFSVEIKNLDSNSQTESEMLVNEIENVPDEEPNVSVEEETQEGYSELVMDKKNTIEEDIPEQDAVENANVDSDVETAINSKSDSMIQVTFDSCKPSGNSYIELIFTVKNTSDENTSISVDSYQYINDIAIHGTKEYNSEIPAGKATVVRFTFRRSDASFSDINKIEFYCTSSDSTGNEIENSFIFDNLDINIK